MAEPHLDSERAEPPPPVAEVLAALAADDTLVVAVRDDGPAAITRGLPAGVRPEDLPAPVLATAGPPATVGVALDRHVDGEAVAHFGRFRDAREAILEVDDPAGALSALGFAQWRTRTRFCPHCGTRLVPRPDGRALHCAGCDRLHFPRLEPAVIMRVTDADDRILLGRQPTWPRGRFSVFAGFVDPGESVEQAVRREVAEEVGVSVTDVTYLGSQPWPFPASLMLGYTARAETTELRLVDDEIAEAEWFDRAGLRDAMADGRVFVPPPVSIAHRMIHAWLGSELRTWIDDR